MKTLTNDEVVVIYHAYMTAEFNARYYRVRPAGPRDDQIARYGTAAQMLGAVVAELQTTHVMSESMDGVIEAAKLAMDEGTAHDDPAPDIALLHRLQDEVEADIPVESLWWPEG